MNNQAPSSILAVEMIAKWSRHNGLSFRSSGSGGAVLSPCGRYRYLLWRNALSSLPFQAFAMLNPSTADALQDDPTIRRCRGFVASPGFTGPLVWNLFAFRATDPNDLKRAEEPIGHLNDSAIDLALSISGRTIAAWGTHGSHLGRDKRVLRRAGAMNATLHALKLTAGGMPGHPLYLPKAAEPVEWQYEW